MQVGYVCLVLAAILLLLFTTHRELAARLTHIFTESFHYILAMEDDKENSKRVRNIGSIVQGVDLTPDDPKHATFKQYRYHGGVRSDQPSLNKVPRELLDSVVPWPLPKSSSTASAVVEGVDQTPDDPKWATFYEYRYDANGVRLRHHIEVKKPKNGVNCSKKITAHMTAPGSEEVELTSTTTATRKVVQRIGLNPNHPQYAKLKDLSAEEIIEEVHKFSLPLDLTYPESGKSSYDPYSSPEYQHYLKITHPAPDSPPVTKASKQSSPPPAPLPSVKLKMSRNKKNGHKKGNCNGKCVVLSQACRVHQAVLDSKDFVDEMLRVIDERFENLHELRAGWDAYEQKTVKELCASCGALHGRGLTKSSFQKEHNGMIEAVSCPQCAISCR